MSAFTVPLYVRGAVIEEDLVAMSGRHAGLTFDTPDVSLYLDELPLKTPSLLADLYEITLDEILDVLVEVGHALDFNKNRHTQQAFEASLEAAPYPESMLKSSYIGLPQAFARERLEQMAEHGVGRAYLEGWVPSTYDDGRTVSVRAFGARSLHIPAGNGGIISAVTIIRNALTRSDAIIKAPSNDPMTAVAIARTMSDVAPNHPLTRHLCVGYWKGGNADIERALYRPEHIEKIIAWGGFASVKHVTQYIQPGLELISLDPKRSATIIGPQAFDSESTMREVAQRLACDIGSANQEGCACARVVYVLSGTDEESILKLNRLGELTFEYIQSLPESISAEPHHYDHELRESLEGTRIDDTFFNVFGVRGNEGAVIVSQDNHEVDYSPLLSGRTANLVPVDDIEQVSRAVNAYTQTVGVYPESLKAEIRDTLPLFGAQRLVSLGYACHVTATGPQDAIEPMRRMCKWIVDEACDPEKVFPMWTL